jgi:hypothetical protein
MWTHFHVLEVAAKGGTGMPGGGGLLETNVRYIQCLSRDAAVQVVVDC